MILGLDTSNYKTSVACFEPESGFWRSEGRFLYVEQGKLGLRQSEALFQHVKVLPEVASMLELDMGAHITAVGYSDRPRELEGSYMPCFLAGKMLAESISSLYGIPAYRFSHQQGHLASALFSVGRLGLLKKPFLAWHLSGGTTELLYVKPDDELLFTADIIGGTSDISAGQAIDRCGVALSTPFPSGKYVEQMALQSDKRDCFTAKCSDGIFSLSGLENKFKDMIKNGKSPSDICSFTLRSVFSTIKKATDWARKAYPGAPLLMMGGVSVCSLLHEYIEGPDIFYACKGLGGDNALGAAVLTFLEMEREGLCRL